MTKNRKISYDNPDEALIAGLEQENAELKAHINSLREALENIAFEGEYDWIEAQVSIALNSTPTQSLAEHDKKVIDEFRAKCEAVIYTSQNDLDNVAYQSKMPCEYKSKGDCTVPLYTLPPIDNEEK